MDVDEDVVKCGVDQETVESGGIAAETVKLSGADVQLKKTDLSLAVSCCDNTLTQIPAVSVDQNQDHESTLLTDKENVLVENSPRVKNPDHEGSVFTLKRKLKRPSEIRVSKDDDILNVPSSSADSDELKLPEDGGCATSDSAPKRRCKRRPNSLPRDHRENSSESNVMLEESSCTEQPSLQSEDLNESASGNSIILDKKNNVLADKDRTLELKLGSGDSDNIDGLQMAGSPQVEQKIEVRRSRGRPKKGAKPRIVNRALTEESVAEKLAEKPEVPMPRQRGRPVKGKCSNHKDPEQNASEYEPVNVDSCSADGFHKADSLKKRDRRQRLKLESTGKTGCSAEISLSNRRSKGKRHSFKNLKKFEAGGKYTHKKSQELKLRQSKLPSSEEAVKLKKLYVLLDRNPFLELEKERRSMQINYFQHISDHSQTKASVPKQKRFYETKSTGRSKNKAKHNTVFPFQWSLKHCRVLLTRLKELSFNAKSGSEKTEINSSLIIKNCYIQLNHMQEPILKANKSHKTDLTHLKEICTEAKTGSGAAFASNLGTQDCYVNLKKLKDLPLEAIERVHDIVCHHLQARQNKNSSPQHQPPQEQGRSLHCQSSKQRKSSHNERRQSQRHGISSLQQGRSLRQRNKSPQQESILSPQQSGSSSLQHHCSAPQRQQRNISLEHKSIKLKKRPLQYQLKQRGIKETVPLRECAVLNGLSTSEKPEKVVKTFRTRLQQKHVAEKKSSTIDIWPSEHVSRHKISGTGSERKLGKQFIEENSSAGSERTCDPKVSKIKHGSDTFTDENSVRRHCFVVLTNIMQSFKNETRSPFKNSCITQEKEEKDDPSVSQERKRKLREKAVTHVEALSTTSQVFSMNRKCYPSRTLQTTSVQTDDKTMQTSSVPKSGRNFSTRQKLPMQERVKTPQQDKGELPKVSQKSSVPKRSIHLSTPQEMSMQNRAKTPLQDQSGLPKVSQTYSMQERVKTPQQDRGELPEVSQKSSVPKRSRHLSTPQEMSMRNRAKTPLQDQSGLPKVPQTSSEQERQPSEGKVNVCHNAKVDKLEKTKKSKSCSRTRNVIKAAGLPEYHNKLGMLSQVQPQTQPGIVHAAWPPCTSNYMSFPGFQLPLMNTFPGFQLPLMNTFPGFQLPLMNTSEGEKEDLVVVVEDSDSDENEADTTPQAESSSVVLNESGAMYMVFNNE